MVLWIEGEIKMKKELIGFSGNTGRSTGPHLHYEIRDENDYPINPLTYKKEKLEDTIPPIIKSLFYKQLFKNNKPKRFSSMFY